jgi:hypothetical protein
MTATQQRAAADYLRETFGVSQRRVADNPNFTTLRITFSNRACLL